MITFDAATETDELAHEIQSYAEFVYKTIQKKQKYEIIEIVQEITDYVHLIAFFFAAGNDANAHIKKMFYLGYLINNPDYTTGKPVRIKYAKQYITIA